MARRRVAGPSTTAETPATTAADRTANLFPKAKPKVVSHTPAKGVRIVCECGFDAGIDVWEQKKRFCLKCEKELDWTLVDEMLADIKAQGGQPQVGIDENGDDVLTCETCGVKLTETALGTAYPCGHDQRRSMKDPLPPRIDPPTPAVDTHARAHVSNNHSEVDMESVVVTWGEEKFSPKQFHVFSVGPFTDTTFCKPGETRDQARARLYAELAKFAEGVREKKRDSFLAAIRSA